MRPTTARLSLLLACAAVAASGCGAGDAAGVTYGHPLAEAATLSVAEVVRRAAELEGRPVRVEGTIADVCAKRGCWIQVADPAEPASVTFKVQDGVMVFPLDAKGKWAVADGTLRRSRLSLEDSRKRLQHEAEEAGRPFDPASVTEPLTFVRLDGIGAVVRDRK